jgi:hypothetical protein
MRNYINEYPIGTLVIKTSHGVQYGIVIDRDFWLEEAAKEKSDDVENFLRAELENGIGFMIPILLFGKTIGSRLKRNGEDVSEEPYTQRYSYSNIGGDISKIKGGVKELLNTLWQIVEYFGHDAWYHEDVRDDVRILKAYLDSTFIIDLANPSGLQEMILLYEKALPRDKLPKNEVSIRIFKLYTEFLRWRNQCDKIGKFGKKKLAESDMLTKGYEILLNKAHDIDSSWPQGTLLQSEWWKTFGITYDPHATIVD